VRTPQIGFAQLVQDFFLLRLVAQRGASARTVEGYRDAFELLLGFIQKRTGTPAAALQLADLDAPAVLDFLDHLETGRGNSTRTRNARLAAIHSFMRYAAVRDPASLAITARVLGGWCFSRVAVRHVRRSFRENRCVHRVSLLGRVR